MDRLGKRRLMAYQTRATRREDGGYNLNFGKGKKKVVAIAKKDPSNGKWFVDTVGHFKKLSDMKKVWGKWAAEQYNGTTPVSPAPTITSSPSSTTIPPIPKRPRKGAVTPVPPLGVDGLKMFAETPDRFKHPNIPALFGDRAGKPTPLGVLLEIQAWHDRYKDRITEINHKIALSRTPGFNPFSFLRLIVNECIEREISDLNRETNDE
jgi:hypothetical protein